MTPSVPLKGKTKPTILMLSVIILAVAVFTLADQSNLEAELAQLEGGLVDANYSYDIQSIGLINKFKYVNNYTIE